MLRGTRLASLCITMCLVLILGATSLRAGQLGQAPRPTRDDDSLQEVQHLAATDADAAVPLSGLRAMTAYGSWSKIAFQSYRDGNWEIYLANGDGSGQVRLTNNPASDTYPRLNRGGTRLAFVSNRTGNYELFTMNSDGSGLTQLTFTTANEYNPAWSPDGSKIAFSSFRDGQSEIYVANANGTGLTRLTNHPAYDGFPAWSPDGARIAFTSDRTSAPNTGNRVWIMNADGSSPQQLSNQAYSQTPIWSPDGSQIAYDSDGDLDGWQELWVMSDEGSTPHQAYEPPYYQTDVWARSWSPDGRYIAVTRIAWTNYQGNWYWTSAYLEGWDTTTGIVGVSLSTSGDDWHPDWQTLDISAPNSSVQALPQYSRAAGTVVNWLGSDVGLAGIKNYDVQYRPGSGGTWLNWLTTAATTSFYTGTPGTTVYFRSRARDNASNLETWPAAAGGDTSTTLYTWQFAGHVTDNRGLSVPQVTIPITPTAVNTVSTDLQGRYAGYLAATGLHTFAATHPGYGSVQSTFDARADQQLSFCLPPQDNVIQNGSFEADDQQLAGWTTSGAITPTIITTSHQLGTRAASLAFSCPVPYPCLSDPETAWGGIYNYPDLTVDMSGTVHLVWNQGQKVYYGYRQPQGSWIGPQLIADNSGYSYGFGPRVAVDSHGGLHVVWNGTSGLYYSEKPPSGDWTTPITLTSSGQEPAIAIDSHDGLHIVYQGNQIYYIERLPSGFWTTPVVVGGGYEWPGIAVGPEDTVHFIWQQVSGGIYYRARLSTGTWTAPQLIYSGDGYSFDPQLIAVDGMGQVYTFWTWAYDGYFATRNLQGEWSVPIAVPKSRGWGDMAVDQRGLVHLLSTSSIWNEEGGYYRQRSVAGQWSDPVKLSSNNIGIVAITADQTNLMHMIWGATYQSTRRAADNQSAAISQRVVLPSDMHRPTLTALYALNGASVIGGQGLAIEVTDEITTTRLVTFTQNAQWTQAWLDLQPWAGQAITVTLNLLQTAGSGYPGLVLDDVSLGEWSTPVPGMMTPNRLDAWTSTIITITGDNFSATPQVHVGNLPALDVHWIDSGTLTVTTPALSPGGYDLLVTNPGGQASGMAYAVIVGKQVFLPIIAK